MCRRGRRAPKGGGLLDPTSPRDVDHVSLICIFSSLPSTRFFGRALASNSIRTSKLSEFAREQSYDGWSTGKFSCVFSETKPWGRGSGQKRTISCYDEVKLGLWWGPGPGYDIFGVGQHSLIRSPGGYSRSGYVIFWGMFILRICWGHRLFGTKSKLIWSVKSLISSAVQILLWIGNLYLLF